MNKRTISCKDCEYYSVKERLSNENKIIRKDYCRRFRKELSSLKPCKRFVEKEEPDTLMEKIIMFPLVLFILGLFSFTGLIGVLGWKTVTIGTLLVTLACLLLCLLYFGIYLKNKKGWNKNKWWVFLALLFLGMLLIAIGSIFDI